MKNLQTTIKNYQTSTNNYERNLLVAEAIENCENTIRYFTLKYRNLPIDSEDLRAELLIVIYKAMDKYREDLGCEFKTYLSRCMEQKCNKLYRDLTRDKRAVKNEEGEIVYSVSYEEMLENGASVEEAEGSCGDYELVEISMLLDSLDLAKEERLICEDFAKGLKPKEIADKLGLSPAMITYKVKKIRAKMQI